MPVAPDQSQPVRGVTNRQYDTEEDRAEAQRLEAQRQDRERQEDLKTERRAMAHDVKEAEIAYEEGVATPSQKLIADIAAGRMKATPPAFTVDRDTDPSKWDYKPGSTPYEMGWRTQKEYITAQSYGADMSRFGGHTGTMVPENTYVLLDARGNPFLRITQEYLKKEPGALEYFAGMGQGLTIPVISHDNKEVYISMDKAREMTKLDGKALMNEQIRMGIIEKGSQYIDFDQSQRQLLYLSKSEIERQSEAKKTFEKDNVRLGDGTYMPRKGADGAMGFDDLSNKYQDIAMQQGYNALQSAMVDDASARGKLAQMSVEQKFDYFVKTGEIPKGAVYAGQDAEGNILYSKLGAGEKPGSKTTFEMAKGLWRFVTPWDESKNESVLTYLNRLKDEKVNGFKIHTPTTAAQKATVMAQQGEYKAIYDNLQAEWKAAPLWAKVLQGGAPSDVIKTNINPSTGKRDGGTYYLRTVELEAPMIGAWQVGGKLVKTAKESQKALKEMKTAVKTLEKSTKVLQGEPPSSILKIQSRLITDKTLEKTPLTASKYGYVSSKAQTLIQRSLKADKAFIAELEKAKSITPGQLSQIEKLTGYKGLKTSITDIGKAQKNLGQTIRVAERAEAAVAKAEVKFAQAEKLATTGTPNAGAKAKEAANQLEKAREAYVKALQGAKGTKGVTQAQERLDKALNAFNSKLQPGRYKKSPSGGFEDALSGLRRDSREVGRDIKLLEKEMQKAADRGALKHERELLRENWQTSREQLRNIREEIKALEAAKAKGGYPPEIQGYKITTTRKLAPPTEVQGAKIPLAGGRGGVATAEKTAQKVKAQSALDIKVDATYAKAPEASAAGITAPKMVNDTKAAGITTGTFASAGMKAKDIEIPAGAYGRVSQEELNDLYGKPLGDKIVKAIGIPLRGNKIISDHKAAQINLNMVIYKDAVQAGNEFQNRNATESQISEAIKDAVKNDVSTITDTAQKEQAKNKAKQLTKTAQKVVTTPTIKPPTSMKPPVKIIPFLKGSPANDKDNRQIVKQRKGAIAWRQGSLVNVGDKWYIIAHPYNAETDTTIVYGAAPAGALIRKGAGSAFATARVIYGSGPDREMMLKMGLFNLRINGIGGNQVKLEYERNTNGTGQKRNDFPLTDKPGRGKLTDE